MRLAIELTFDAPGRYGGSPVERRLIRLLADFSAKSRTPAALCGILFFGTPVAKEFCGGGKKQSSGWDKRRRRLIVDDFHKRSHGAKWPWNEESFQGFFVVGNTRGLTSGGAVVRIDAGYQISGAL